MLLLDDPITAVTYDQIEVTKTEFDGMTREAVLRLTVFSGTLGAPDCDILGHYPVTIRNGVSSKVERAGSQFQFRVSDVQLDLPFGYDSLVAALQAAGANTANAALQWCLDNGVLEATFTGELA